MTAHLFAGKYTCSNNWSTPLLVTGVALTVFLLFTTSCWGFRNLEVGRAVPDFALQGLDGKSYSLSQSKGSLVVILYWRIGQERSHSALEALKSLAKEFSDQPIRIFAITKDLQEKSKLESVRKTLDIPFPILIDRKEEVYSSFGIFVFPATAIIDKKGTALFLYSGLRDEYRTELSQQIRLALGLITAQELEKEKQKKGAQLSKEQRKALDHVNLGKKLRDRLLDEKALQEFKKAVELDPGNAEGHELLGLSLLEKEKTDEAIASFKKALQLNPRSTDAQVGLGSAYRLQGKNDEALEILKKGVFLCPSSAIFHLELGRTYESMGKTAEALQHYKKAAECSLKVKWPQYAK